ncbi:MAG TPA: preprotein translocase subunit YajC [Chthoniobacteraceae bacterium]|jgi:preprotein translocase subunit YajC
MTSALLLILAQAPGAPAQNPFSMLVPFVCIGVIFYFLIIRPQSKRQKELAALVGSLKTGDKVVTTGGIHGIISNVKEGHTLSLKIADNVKIEIDKSAIASVSKSSESSSAATAA